MVNGFKVLYIEPLPMPVVDLTPAIIVILVVAIIAWGLRAIFRAVADDEIRTWPQ